MYNTTKISIELQDSGGKSALIKILGERNNEVFFDELFRITDEQIYPLRLHILSEKEYDYNGGLTVLVLKKLLQDIEKRGKRTCSDSMCFW